MLARLMAPPILALALLAAPLTAETQPAGKIPRIGYLSTGSAAWNPFVEAFRQGLRETGWIEGQNIFGLAHDHGANLCGLADKQQVPETLHEGVKPTE